MELKKQWQQWWWSIPEPTPETGVEWYLKNNQNTKRKSEEHRIKRDNSKPRKQKNEYPKRGGEGSDTKNANGSKSEHISVL